MACQTGISEYDPKLRNALTEEHPAHHRGEYVEAKVGSARIDSPSFVEYASAVFLKESTAYRYSAGRFFCKWYV